MNFLRVICICCLVLSCNPSTSEKKTTDDLSVLFDTGTEQVEQSETENTPVEVAENKVEEMTPPDTLKFKPLPQDAPVYQMPFVRRQGQRYSIRITKEKKRTDAGVVKKDERLVSDIDVLVKEVNNDGFLIEWKYRRIQSNTGRAIMDQASEIANFVEHETLLIQTDSSGSPIKLVNAEELISNIQLITNALVENAGSKLKTEKARQAFKNTMEKLLSPDRIRAELLEPVTIMHIASGGTYSPGDSVFYESSLPNILGGNPIRGLGFITMTNYDAAKKQGRIVWGQQSDREDTRNVIVEFLKRLSVDSGRAIDLEELPRFNIVDRAVIDLDAHHGWVLRNEYIRTTDALTVNETQRLLIETMPPTK